MIQYDDDIPTFSSETVAKPKLQPFPSRTSFESADLGLQAPFQGVDLVGCDRYETASILEYLRQDPTLGSIACLDPKSRPWYRFDERRAVNETRLEITKEQGRFLLSVVRYGHHQALRELAREVDIAYARDIASLFQSLSLTFVAMQNTLSQVFGEVCHLQEYTSQRLVSNPELLALYREHSAVSMKNFLGLHSTIEGHFKHSLILDLRSEKQSYNFLQVSQKKLLEIYEDESE